MRNRRRKCDIASRCTKTAGQILADIAKQTVTPALATRFEGVKVDICGSPVLFSVYAKLTLHTAKFTHNIGLRVTAPFVFLQTYFVRL